MSKKLKELAGACFDFVPDEDELRSYTNGVVRLAVSECLRVLRAQPENAISDDALASLEVSIMKSILNGKKRAKGAANA